MRCAKRIPAAQRRVEAARVVSRNSEQNSADPEHDHNVKEKRMSMLMMLLMLLLIILILLMLC